MSWTKFWSLKHTLTGPSSLYHKSQIFNSCIIPSKTYGAQTWAPTQKDTNKLTTTQNKMERAMLGIKLKDKVKTNVIKNKTKYNQDIVHSIRRAM